MSGYTAPTCLQTVKVIRNECLRGYHNQEDCKGTMVTKHNTEDIEECLSYRQVNTTD